MVPGEVYMQSTDVNRTMQSGYSELMGIYAPGSNWQLSADELDSLSSGLGMPALTVHNAGTINSELGANPLPNGFVSMPQITYVNADIKDDIMFSGCEFVETTQQERRNIDTTYRDYQWIADFAREPLADCW